ncbi:MAG TPA: M1 family aminopeptidase [Kofleriaceae bacterium]|nr:M1 family aminopeptidase [Kofleriaceae bacterium]
MKREFAMPGARPRYTPDRVCAVKHIKLDIALDVDARRISGTCTLTLSPLLSGSPWLRLDAVELDIASAVRDGKRLEHGHDGKVLRVALGEVKEGEELDLVIAYSGQPRRGIYFIGPDESYPDKPVQVWTQGQDEDSRFWFPCFDTPSEKATSEIIATVPARFTAVSNGILVADDTSGDQRTMHWRFDVPHSCYLMTLVAGEMAELRERWNDVEVTYYVEPGREEDARRTLGRTPRMLEVFSRLFGVPYPYGKYAQLCVADFIFGGMENTTATTLTDTVLYDERAALDFDADSLVSHELAHQWFGDLLTCRAWAEGWLNEGFATYSEYLWREAHEGRDAADHELDGWGEQYFNEDSSRYRRTMTTNVYDEPIDIFDHHLYDKGGRVLHMLRGVLGDDGFFRAIKHYLGKHRGGSVETRDLARAVEDVTGRQMDWFFDQWVTKGAGHPELDVHYEWDADKKLAVFTVKQTHKVEGSTPLFRVPVALALSEGKARRRIEVEVTDQLHTFYVSCAGEPTQAIFDPGKAVLARIKTEKPAPMWIAELGGAELAIDRIHAARELGTRGGTKATQALVDALADDPSWLVQSAAADALGKLRTDGARDALIAAVATTEHPRARRAVVRALGQFRGDDLAGATLARVVERGDPSYFVEAEACLSLGRTRWSGAPELLRRAAERESFLDVIRQHAYRGLAEARDESAIPFLVAGTEYGRVSHGRRAALAALADLARGRRDQAERDARERIEELLRDLDFRVRFAALESLAVLADPASMGALRDLIDRELDGRLRRRAREIVRDIGESRTATAEVSSLRDDVEKLRGDLARLREQLERMQAAGDKPGEPAGPRPRNGAPSRRRAPTVRDTVRRPAPTSPRRKPPARTSKRTPR